MKYIKSKIVRLPTEEATKIIQEDNILKYNPSKIDVGTKEYQHLYFLSDEEIQEGDWYMYLLPNNEYYKIYKSDGSIKNNDSHKKIIATTDESLIIEHHFIDSFGKKRFRGINLPRPSNEFLKKYCELGGIDEVMVEYEVSIGDNNGKGTKWHPEYDTELVLKVAPDNTITIKPIEPKLYTREEVIEFIHKIISDFNDFAYCYDDGSGYIEVDNKEFNKWIEINIK